MPLSRVIVAFGIGLDGDLDNILTRGNVQVAEPRRLALRGLMFAKGKENIVDLREEESD